MIFGENRSELRQMYADAWRKFCADELLTPLEAQIAAVVEEHPEYQALVSGGAIEASFTADGGQTNPFLHMGLHLALREQVSTDRPPGIAATHRRLAQKNGNPHTAEHSMLEALAETLWEAQSENRAPDEIKYMERLRRLS
ncbi:MAG: DUF1841 family protein [Gammaproteobacteria bacterium]|nr:DUF1841 family protein [Gammaproteobacteria bacterium]